MQSAYETFDHEALFQQIGNIDELIAGITADIEAMPEEDKAVNALRGILTVRNEDGSSPSSDELITRTTDFLSRPEIQGNLALLDRVAVEFAYACANHMHGTELSEAPGLSDLFKHGKDHIEGAAGSHGHNHAHEDDEETDKKSKKRKSSAKTSARGKQSRFLARLALAA